MLPGQVTSSLSADDDQEIFGTLGGIGWGIVLVHNSNFALAVHHAVRHALNDGFMYAVKETAPVGKATQQQQELRGIVAV